MQLDPTNTSAGDLVTVALRMCKAIGVGQTPLAEDLTEGQTQLQWMLQEWERKRWLVYYLATYSIPSSGQQSYTVGPNGEINTSLVNAWGVKTFAFSSQGTGYAPGDTVSFANGLQVSITTVGFAGQVTGATLLAAGQFPSPLPSSIPMVSTSGSGTNFSLGSLVWTKVNQAFGGPSVRPAKIQSAFVRLLQNTGGNVVDYPLTEIPSREDYNKLALKSLGSFPQYFYYAASWPLGEFYPWPVPASSLYTLLISVMDQLPVAFASSSALVSLPYEYYFAIVTNLAIRLMPHYGLLLQPGDPLVGMAKDALNTIRGANQQISTLEMPRGLSAPGLYNIFSDTGY